MKRLERARTKTAEGGCSSASFQRRSQRAHTCIGQVTKFLCRKTSRKGDVFRTDGILTDERSGRRCKHVQGAPEPNRGIGVCQMNQHNCQAGKGHHDSTYGDIAGLDHSVHRAILPVDQAVSPPIPRWLYKLMISFRHRHRGMHKGGGGEMLFSHLLRIYALCVHSCKCWLYAKGVCTTLRTNWRSLSSRHLPALLLLLDVCISRANCAYSMRSSTIESCEKNVTLSFSPCAARPLVMPPGLAAPLPGQELAGGPKHPQRGAHDPWIGKSREGPVGQRPGPAPRFDRHARPFPRHAGAEQQPHL